MTTPLRRTCLRCEQNGNWTELVVVPGRGGICPVHSADFLRDLKDEAKMILGIPLQLITKGEPGWATRR